MTVLVTSGGLLGAHAARMLLDQGLGVTLFDPNPQMSYVERVVGEDRKLFYVEAGETRDFPRLMDVMLGRGITRILHVGAFEAAGPEDTPSLAFQASVAGTLNVIEAARIRSLNRIVVVVSAAYPAPEDAPSGQEPYTAGHSTGPSSFRAAYLSMTEIMTLAYHRLRNVNAIVCRLCPIYGLAPRYVEEPAASIASILEASLVAPPGGEVAVSFPATEMLYVWDAAYAVREAVYMDKPSARTYDVGSGEAISSGTLARAIRAVVPGAQPATSAEDAADVPVLDSRLARRDLKFQPEWPLTRGLGEMAEQLRTTTRVRR